MGVPKALCFVMCKVVQKHSKMVKYVKMAFDLPGESEGGPEVE